MNNLDRWVKRVHLWLDHSLLRIIAIVLSMVTAGLVMWDPTHFALAIGGFGPVVSPVLIWATCATMVYGVGFVPQRWYWQVLFTPYLSLLVLLNVLSLRLL
ncbi:cyd operon protein YbgE [Photobacterium nomapromontoriensis]|uniref:cyd operon protein YbgE n=1 Tax=Photobacterium nomapromontoriensis TaxID=2910237 RepID=UPI003D0E6A1E